MNATIHGWRIVRLVPPRWRRTISGARNRIDIAIDARSARPALAPGPSVAAASVRLCASVNDVIGSEEHPPVGDEQEQAETNKEVIDAEHDVIPSQPEVRAGHAPTARLRGITNDGSLGVSRTTCARPFCPETRTSTSNVVAERLAIEIALPARPPGRRMLIVSIAASLAYDHRGGDNASRCPGGNCGARPARMLSPPVGTLNRTS
jgi:hypothetical protein